MTMEEASLLRLLLFFVVFALVGFLFALRERRLTR